MQVDEPAGGFGPPDSFSSGHGEAQDAQTQEKPS
jgi:hypothetical protein